MNGIAALHVRSQTGPNTRYFLNFFLIHFVKNIKFSFSDLTLILGDLQAAKKRVFACQIHVTGKIMSFKTLNQLDEVP